MSGTSRKKPKKGFVKRKKKLSPAEKIAAMATIVATASLIVVVVSLIVSINQVKESRKQTKEMCKQTEKMFEYYRLATVPRLNVNTERRWQLNRDVGLYIENSGPGPAFITNITIELNGKTYNVTDEITSQKVLREIQDLMGVEHSETIERSPELWSSVVHCKYYNYKYCLSSGQEKEFLLITLNKPNYDIFMKFNNILLQMRVKIEYESIYGEKFSHYYNYGKKIGVK